MPKTFSDFEKAVYRYLDGEMSVKEKNEFLSRCRKEPVLNEIYKQAKNARKAMQVYKYILPPAKEFTRMRKSILANI